MIKDHNRLLVISSYFVPYSTSAVHRVLGFTKFLSKKGWDITVLTLKHKGLPVDEALKRKVPPQVQVIQTGHLDLFSLWDKIRNKARKGLSDSNASNPRLAFQEEKKSSIGSRLKTQLTLLLKTPDSYVGWIPVGVKRMLAERSRWNVIFATAPSFSALLLGVCLKILWRVPLVADLRDPWVGNPFNLKRSGLSARLDRFLEALVFKRADLIIANTEPAAGLYKKRYPEHFAKIKVITNGFEDAFVDVAPERLCHLDRLSIVHAGAIYGDRDIRPLVEALTALDNSLFVGSKLHLKLVGTIEGDKRRFIEARNFENVAIDLSPPVSHRKAIALLKGADVVLVVGNCTQGSVQVPAKIFELLPLSQPIWLIDSSQSPAYHLLAETGMPFFFSNNKKEDIKKELMRIFDCWRKGCLNQLSVNNPNIQAYSRATLSNQLHEYLLQLVTRS